MPVISGSTVIRGSRGTPVAQDADDKLITVIQGSQGTPIAQDATDRLIAMMYGSAGNPIAQDAFNNLISVMKGDYLGSLETVALDANFAMKAVLYDSVDVWGNQPGVGLAEHAVRTGSPILYDRRGEVFWYNTFDQSPISMTYAGGVTGSLSLTTTARESGQFGVKISTAIGVGANHGVRAWLPIPLLTTRIGVEAAFTIDDDEQYKYLQCDIHTSATISYYPRLRLDVQNSLLQYMDNAGVYQNIGAVVLQEDLNTPLSLFYHMKLVFDLATGTYVRAMFGNIEFAGVEIAGIAMRDTGAGAQDMIDLQYVVYSNIAGGVTSYLDMLVLTRNEP
ncbi:MAG: hypothetical protein KAJ19_17090 [Gammaproteobacteria bacterium]|nr:hypothetical protein [Gammaproteobacteria bacterium]